MNETLIVYNLVICLPFLILDYIIGWRHDIASN